MINLLDCSNRSLLHLSWIQHVLVDSSNCRLRGNNEACTPFTLCSLSIFSFPPNPPVFHKLASLIIAGKFTPVCLQVQLFQTFFFVYNRVSIEMIFLCSLIPSPSIGGSGIARHGGAM
ncbi:hypothetical protein PGT21_008547 [Puccinia graminis f. sp. tritici]|uniref:Uncharacterized protein n=1 Tax=Puccinia graminis f. sp. tritici TaxID=56615 RepID=A0A5B0PXA7_PUCGR|nr:hypothetical protein PGT21_008547 [Puccinia graminis f. sp. tritici]